MKKNLLFVMPSLGAGGGEKSLVNLLSQIDFDLYNVDLFLFNHSGLFINSLPKEVKVVEVSSEYNSFTAHFPLAIWSFLKKGQISLAYSRFMFSVVNKVTKNVSKAEQYSWKYISRSVSKLDKEYDAAIGFLEKSSIYFVVEKVKSRKKIGWIHTNYSNSGMNKKLDQSFFKKLDHLITVSEECAISLEKNFSFMANKIEVIYNIISPTVIKHMSHEEEVNKKIFKTGDVNILTVARLSREKGIDLALQACRLLVEKKYNVKWYVLGEGSEREELETLIEKYQLEEYFILLGTTDNPYPYFKRANVYVQPSRYEGKSIAIDEAKILQKPIIITNYNTAKDQISHEVNGLIVDLTPESIASGIEKVLSNPHFTKKLLHNLSREKLGTEDEINKFYAIV